MGAMALSIGIAIQNFPEGAIISMPLRSEGMGKTKAFAGGVLSGIVEPVGAVLTILAAGLICPGTSISFKLRSRSYALCSSRRTHTRNVCRRTLQHWNYFLCGRILSDDDSGCSSWIKNSCPIYHRAAVLALRDIWETVETCEGAEPVE